MQTRDKKLDLLRTIAILSVVFCHSIEAYYYMYQDQLILWSQISYQSRVFNLIGITIGRLGVPFFLFLTGILTTKKDFSKPENVKKFYKNNFLKLLITLEIWIVIWNVFLIIAGRYGLEVPKVTAVTFIENIFLLKTVSFILPAWYTPMILGIYLFIPIISNTIKSFRFSDIKFPIIIGIIIMFIFPTLNITGIFSIDLYTDLYLMFSGGAFGIYLFLGKYIYDGILKNIKTIYLYLSIIISFVLCISIQYYCLNKGVYHKLWYDNIFVLIYSVSIFEIIRRQYKPGEISTIIQSIFSHISQISFPIFLIHNIVQYIIYFNSSFIFKYNRLIRVSYMFTVSFIITIIIIEILRKNKLLSNYLLRIKN